MAYEAVSVRPTDRWLVGTGTKPDPALHKMHKLMDGKNTFISNGVDWINTSIDGALNIHDSHIHHVPVNEFFHLHSGLITTVNWDVLPGSRVITVLDDTIFAVGDELQLTTAAGTFRESTFPVITAIDLVTHVLTLDRPLDSAWSIGDTVEIIFENMAVTGSLYSPVSYKMYPIPGTIMHVESFVLNITMSSTGDDSIFGNLTELTNGAILRAYNGAQGLYGTFTNWKTNGDIRMDMATIEYHDKAGGGLHSVAGDGRISERTGAIPELIADNGDYLEILIQDDLVALATFRLKAQGHIEGR